jgi:DNA polymerase-3 subunit gamma/tau
MSEHLALYRKYRPEKFKNVAGQEAVVDLLTKSLDSGKVAHAYLFCGGRGTGKTSVARIFARELKTNPEDIIEIDAASNRGIDEIRELREAVRSMPFSSAYKVYIVDEVHMLTKEASNALLKTLEEPPKHVIFILATTDPEKLPQTIISRCQKIEFKQPTLEILSKVLSTVAKDEDKKLTPDAALLIAKHGKGSYRDALGVLEQILVRVEGDTVEKEDVALFLGLPSEAIVISLLEALCKKDQAQVLTVLENAKQKNIIAIDLYKELIEYTRLALLARVGQTMLAKHQLESVQKELETLAKTYPKEINSAKVLKLLDMAKYFSIPHIVNTYTILEMICLSSIEE